MATLHVTQPENDLSSKLAIGTAQFGIDYGVSNVDGQTSVTEAGAIIDQAVTDGINMVDTAPAYGESEQVLGQVLHGSMQIVTKTIIIESETIGDRAISQAAEGFSRSLQFLQRTQVYGLLVHSANDLLKPGGELLAEWLSEIKQQGLAKKIGVSVYTAEQLDAVCGVMDVDLVQLPFNILDQRLLVSGHLQSLAQQGIEIHARSAFLQGLLLMDPAALPDYFMPYQAILRRFHEAASSVGSDPLTLALLFVLHQHEIGRVVVGVNRVAQLQQILGAIDSSLPHCVYDELSTQDAALLDPSQWKL